MREEGMIMGTEKLQEGGGGCAEARKTKRG